MVSSKKPPRHNLVSSKKFSILGHLKLFLRDLFLKQKRINPSILIAYSGGLDSSVLLHALYQLQTEIPMHLRVMHVNHGLSEHADSWVSFCKKICADLSLPLNVHQVQVDQNSGLGTEAAARNVRYHALESASADFICLGHHQDDQAETLLLQLARGSGVKGLAGMAEVNAECKLLRPFLNVRYAELVAYATQHQLRWIEDESNKDVAFDRNFMRHEIVPALRKRYPNITKTLARSALHMADASEIMNDLAMLDSELVLDKGHQYGALRLGALNVLSKARQRSLIRWWLASNQVSMPSAALSQQILQQFQSPRTDTAIKIKVADNLFIRRFRGLGYLVHETVSPTPINLRWQDEAVIVLPDRSRLFFVKKIGEGFAYQRGGNDIQLRVKYREGGERFKPTIGRPRRGLKYILQSVDMPPWQRELLPLIFMDETLVMIPNVAVDADMKASSDEMGLRVSWQPATI
ncbi:MAG: tRNA lysidine(34) synthetase TilS [Methylophilaceae bacterium]